MMMWGSYAIVLQLMVGQPATQCAALAKRRAASVASAGADYGGLVALRRWIGWIGGEGYRPIVRRQSSRNVECHPTLRYAPHCCNITTVHTTPHSTMSPFPASPSHTHHCHDYIQSPFICLAVAFSPRFRFIMSPFPRPASGMRTTDVAAHTRRGAHSG